MADDIVVISGGVLRAAGPLEQVLGGGGEPVTRVRSLEPTRLAELLIGRGLSVVSEGGRTLRVTGSTPEAVGAIAAEHGVALAQLVAESRSLEDAFLDLTGMAA